ncbi:hypothetical protein [Streptomyces sp. NBC_01216]|uniref:hypothetical protein n=1 Tax=unclassified Streptomyces TaxID=2593676 RepID=UPI002E12FF60|nr:hypothetical protein OG393_10900 [Streptomyces sp. NBC_01216]
MTALASAAMASPAAAADAPVVVPLQGLEPVIPMDAPTLATGVPLPVPGAPTGFQKGGGLPDVSLPRVPLGSTLPETVVAAPLPEVLDGSEPGKALFTTSRSEVAAATPGATVGNPVLAPRGEHLGLPDLTVPQIGVLAPAATGALDSQLGLAQPGA